MKNEVPEWVTLLRKFLSELEEGSKTGAEEQKPGVISEKVKHSSSNYVSKDVHKNKFK
tara:strand:+ start:190 stop:363 length:174 start_codon:yes stop_codon:yes gene_type:complete